MYDLELNDLDLVFRYAIMLRCWNKFPTDRPEFSQLVSQLDRQLMASLSDDVSFLYKH
jgi:hypothetical protein